MDSTQTFRFSNRGPSALVRLVFFASVSLLLLFVDGRYHYLESTRTALSVLISPIQQLAVLPSVLWDSARERLYTQDSLVRANTALEQQHQRDSAALLRLRALMLENTRLRLLATLSPPTDHQMQIAEVVYAERDVFKRKVLLDKGSNTLVQAGQAVMDERGIVGQITRVYPWLSELTLITEKDHAVPVQVLRNGLRTVLQGMGDTSQLVVRYLPTQADIQVGDVLITSGIDGVYPAGIPVGRVLKIEHDPAYPFAKVICAPVAGIDNHKQLLILSTPTPLPELPLESAVLAPLKPRKK